MRVHWAWAGVLLWCAPALGAFDPAAGPQIKLVTPGALDKTADVMALGAGLAGHGLGDGFVDDGAGPKWGDYRILLFQNTPGDGPKTLGAAPANPFVIGLNADELLGDFFDAGDVTFDEALRAYWVLLHEKAHHQVRSFWGGGYCLQPGCLKALQSLEECADLASVNGLDNANACSEAYADSKSAADLCEEACRKHPSGSFVHSATERAALQTQAKEAANRACVWKQECDARMAECQAGCEEDCAEAFDAGTPEHTDCTSECAEGLPFPDKDDPQTPGADVPPGDCPAEPYGPDGWTCSCEEG